MSSGTVLVAKGANARSVAELGLHKLLSMARNTEGSREELEGKTLHVVGSGGVGSEMIRLAQAVGMNVRRL